MCKRDDIVLLQDIDECIENINRYTTGITAGEFCLPMLVFSPTLKLHHTGCKWSIVVGENTNNGAPPYKPADIESFLEQAYSYL